MNFNSFQNTLSINPNNYYLDMPPGRETVMKIFKKYQIIQQARKNGLNLGNLGGLVLDIGCHIGLTVDALSYYGGNVVGTDYDDYVMRSPFMNVVKPYEGIEFVKKYKNPSLISCFNIDWVNDHTENCSNENNRNNDFLIPFFDASYETLERGGQFFATFGHGYQQEIKIATNGRLFKLPFGYTGVLVTKK